jgi:hypothetical protein
MEKTAFVFYFVLLNFHKEIKEELLNSLNELPVKPACINPGPNRDFEIPKILYAILAKDDLDAENEAERIGDLITPILKNYGIKIAYHRPISTESPEYANLDIFKNLT